VGKEIMPTEDYTFTKLLDLGLMDHLELCAIVGEKAAKEYNIENELKKMKNEWEEIEFVLVEYKKMTHIISGTI